MPNESRVELCWVYTLCMRAMMASPAEDSTRPFRSMSAGHKEATWPSGVGAEERKERADRRLDVTWKVRSSCEQVIELAIAIVTWSGVYRRLGAFAHARSQTWFVSWLPAPQLNVPAKATAGRMHHFTSPRRAGLACDGCLDRYTQSKAIAS